MSTKNFNVKINVPEGIQVSFENNLIKLKNPKLEVEKKLLNPYVKINVKGNEIELVTEKMTKKEKRVINTFRAHINNMIKGLNKVYTYKLKICSSHFPISAIVDKNILLIKNFMGEKVPRKAKILPNVSVKVQGEVIVVESSSKESAGQTTANIERACRRPGFDTRVFSDGIWMTQRAGKDLK